MEQRDWDGHSAALGSVYQIVRNRTSASGGGVVLSDAITVRIDRIVAGGNGIGFADGRAVLVPMTAPGDLVEVRPGRKGPQANLLRLLETGPDRTEPRCRHYGVCGGCNLMHLTYPAQLDAKRSMVVDALHRIAGQAPPADFVMVPSPEPFGVRARATWHPSPGGRPGYMRRGSNETIEITACPILEPALEAVRRSLEIDRRLTGLTNGDQVSLSAEGAGRADIEVEVAGAAIRTHAGAFFQSNIRLLDAFVRAVMDAGQFTPSDDVWDLYAGVGLFTLPIGAVVRNVWSVEADETASELARNNARRLAMDNISVHTETAEAWLRATRQHAPDAIVVDPPRVGLSTTVVDGLSRIRPSRIVYVSCDPPTFARDVARLAEAGYRLATLTGFDMFPQTSHVELVSRLELSTA